VVPIVGLDEAIALLRAVPLPFESFFATSEQPFSFLTLPFRAEFFIFFAFLLLHVFGSLQAKVFKSHLQEQRKMN